MANAAGNANASKTLSGPCSIPPAGLHAPTNASEDRRGDIGYYEHSLAKKGKKIEIFVKVMEIDTGIKLDKSKTIGTITTKNSDKILMTARSGYSTGEKRDNCCLDTNKWNSLTLSEYLVPRYNSDRNSPGNCGTTC